jgi:hypothetical protein
VRLSIGLIIKTIIAEFVVDPQADQEGGSHADGETEDVDSGKRLAPPKVSDGDLEEVAQHKIVVGGVDGFGKGR